MPKVVIGVGSSDRLVLDALRRESRDSTDYWSGNSLVVDVDVAAGALSGMFTSSLRVDELARFRDELEILYADLAHTAPYESMDRWLTLELAGDGRGHIRVRGTVREHVTRYSALAFETEIDQTELREIIRQLEAILSTFPLVGRD